MTGEVISVNPRSRPRAERSATLLRSGALSELTWRLARGLAGLVGLTALVVAERAQAHPEYTPSSTNRYLKLSLVQPNEARLLVSVMYGSQPATEERRRADQNHDGRIEPREAQALGDALARRVESELRLLVDGAERRVRFEPAVVGLLGEAVDASPLSIDLTARIELPAQGRHSLSLDDPTALPRPGETEVRIEESPLVRVVGASQGRTTAPSERTLRFTFAGARRSSFDERWVTVDFEPAPNSAQTNRATDSQRRWLWVGLPLLIAAALWRRRRGTKSTEARTGTRSTGRRP
jgi:hypothetical protein